MAPLADLVIETAIQTPGLGRKPVADSAAAGRRGVLILIAGMLALGGCAVSASNPGSAPNPGPTPNRGPAVGWQPPPGAVAAPLSAARGPYDFSGATVKLDGQLMDPGAVLDALNRTDSLVLGQITPEATPIPASLRIVLPDHDRLRVLAIQAVKQPGGGAVEFEAERMRLQQHVLADVVVRRHLFTAANLTEQNDTVAPDAAGADYVLWFMVRSVSGNNAGPWVGAWQLKRSGAAAADMVGVDPGTPFGPPRALSFANSIRMTIAHQMGGNMAIGSAGSRRVVSAGTGIAVDAQGHVLTNNHVIAGCPDLRVTDSTGSTSASLLAADPANDLAVLRTGRHATGWASFRDGQGLRPGESLVVTGFPLTGVVSPEMAVTTGSLTALAGAGGDVRQLQFSAPIQPGNSGGPVLDETGKVIGVASSMLDGLMLAALTGMMPQNVNFAVKTSVVRAFLQANQIAVDSGPAHAAMSAAAIGDSARRFTVKIECWR